MPWQYSQSTGELTHLGHHVATGYSGHGAGKNNASMDRIANVGPIPTGTYDIGSPHHSPHTGLYTMNLSPQAGTDTFGRSAFRIHGDSRAHPGGASEGCIILPSSARHRIWGSHDHSIQVVQ